MTPAVFDEMICLVVVRRGKKTWVSVTFSEVASTRDTPTYHDSPEPLSCGWVGTRPIIANGARSGKAADTPSAHPCPFPFASISSPEWSGLQEWFPVDAQSFVDILSGVSDYARLKTAILLKSS